VLTFLGGWAMIFLEIRRPEIRDSVLVLGGSLLGVPGLALGASSVVEAIRSRTGTAGPSGSPPAGPSSSSQPSSSPAA
jgi:hypothetical protein